MARKETKVPLNLRVEESLVERLDVLAQKMGLDRSEVARRVIKGGLDDMEQVIRAAGNPMGELLIRFASLIDGNAEDRAELSKILRNIADDKQRRKGTKPIMPEPA